MIRKRRKLKKKNISLLLLVIAVIITCIILFINHQKDVPSNNTTTQAVEEVKPQVDTLTLVMAGDALIHDRLYNDAYHDGGYDFKPYLKLIKEKVKDFIVANSKLRRRFINSYPNILEKIKEVLEKSKLSLKK